MNRVRALALEERAAEIARGEKRWYYVSFANDTAFLGAAFIEGFGRSDVFLKSWEIGLNPGDCSVMIVKGKEGALPPEGCVGRLLSRADVERIDAMARWPSLLGTCGLHVAEMLQECFPELKWREPIIMQTAHGSTPFACRICIALNGFDARTPDDLLKHPRTRNEFQKHMAEVHPKGC